MNGPYDDIIRLPHPVSATRPQMPVATRAAQFSPFAALTGYDAAIAETARPVDARIDLEEDAKIALDQRLRILADAIGDHPVIAVTCFREDEKKHGGAYVTIAGAAKKIDDCGKAIILMNGERISIEDILDMEGALFNALG